MKLLLKAIIFVALVFPLTGMTTSEEEYMKKFCKAKCSDSVLIKEAVYLSADAYKVSPRVILAIIKVESGFNKHATNGSSVGLMQVHLKYHKQKFKGSDPYGIFSNVFVGTGIFRDCINKHKGNIKKSLRCYNGGGDSQYTEKVLATLNTLKKEMKI